MPNIVATVQLHIKVEALPPEIPGVNGGHQDSFNPPVSGTEQVTYEVFKRIQEILPENVYALVESATLLDD